MTTWHKGPPPSIGWWPASWHRNPEILRWWHGKQWSVAVYSEESAETAAPAAAHISLNQSDIEWTDRPADWPERSKT